MRLVDFKVRITHGETEAVPRVVIDSEDMEDVYCYVSATQMQVLTHL